MTLWPRHPLLFLLAFAAIVTVPQFIPQLFNWRIFEWSTVAHVLDFQPRQPSIAPLEEEQARMRPDLTPARQNAHRIVDPQLVLAPFYAALLRVERREPGAVVRILHYGDSPSTADLITADVRALLQHHFGDAGHGVYLIAKPWAWYDHRGVYSKSSGWVIDPATRHAQPDGWYGLGGVSFTGKPGAWSKIALRDPGQTRLVLHYVGQPGSGKVRITAGDVHIATLDTSMPQKTAAHETWRIPADAQNFEIEVEDAPVRLFCVEFLKDADGVIYNSLGLNGTWAGVLAWYMNGPHWSDQLKEARPDLVVLNYGTNESGFPKYVDSTYVKDVREIVRRIRTALPATPILVMSPMDRGVRESGGTIGTISALPRLVQKQAQVATETGCAFFNTFEAMGGSGTMGRWYQAEPRMVSADFIHPLPSGARIVGALLYQALYDGYNNWKMQQLRQTRTTAAGTSPAGAQPQERRAR
jgi:lysophospholipase L1-like esterase